MKIFVIDDFKPYIYFLQENIHSLIHEKDLDFYFFDNPKEAFNAIKKEKPGVIITDMVMPTMDGYALIQNIRQIYNPVVIIISILDYIRDVSAEFVIQKPLTDIFKLVDTINRAVELATERLIHETFHDTDCSSKNKQFFHTASYTLMDTVEKDRMNSEKDNYKSFRKKLKDYLLKKEKQQKSLFNLLKFR